MSETHFACSRRELQESFRVEQSRFVSLVQQDLEKVQRQREFYACQNGALPGRSAIYLIRSGYFRPSVINSCGLRVLPWACRLGA
eukprot:6405404-Amphidinium_carterae.1